MTTAGLGGERELACGTVLAVLRRQAALYERLEAYAGRQRLVVAEDDASSLLSVLCERQKLSEELGRVTREFEPLRRRWTEVRAMLPASERTEAEQLLSGMKDRLRRVMEGDEEDARLLSARKGTVESELRGVRSAGRALDGYAGARGPLNESGLDEAT